MSDWKTFALEAFDLAFSASGNKKENLSNETLTEAIGLFYKSILSGADEYWPYIKLADLVSSEQEKLKLYAQAWKVQPNIYSAEKLFNQILLDNPNILDRYDIV
jgi:hypothetical protein